MLVVNNLNYASQNTILFQRFSVIFTDFVYVLSVMWFCSNYYYKKEDEKSDYIIPILSGLMILHPGLLMVDRKLFFSFLNDIIISQKKFSL